MGRARVALRKHAGICGVALLAGTIAVVTKLVLFRHYSGNLDEPVYVLQAKTLASGHLTLSAAAHGDFFRPWLTGEHAGRLFTKYLPGYSAVLAAPLVIVRTAIPALPFIAAAWVTAVYAFACELLGDRRLALVAAGLMALSPIFVIHSALFLSYGLSVALLLGGAALVLRGSRTGRTAPAVLGGTLLGFDVLVRQYDVVLVVALLAIYLLLLPRVRRPRLLRTAGAALAGATPWLLVTLAYNAQVTGSPLRFPLSATDPLDRFGFGWRRILPGQPEVYYGVHDALRALGKNLRTVPSWTAGGVLLLALALVGLLVGGRRREKFLLLGLVLVFPLGYFFFWGTALSAPTAINGIGPHYYMPMFAGLAILAAAGLERVLTTPLRLAVPATLVLVVLAVPLTWSGLGPKFDVQRFVNHRRAIDIAPLRATPVRTPAVVLIDLPDNPLLAVGNPYGYLSNRPDLTGSVLYAASQGPRDWRLPDVAPGRTLYALRPEQLDRGDSPFGVRGALALLHPLVATRLQVDVAMTAQPGVGNRCLTAYVLVGSTTVQTRLTCGPRPGTTYRHTFVVGSGGLPLPSPGSSTLLTAGVATSGARGGETRAEVRNSLGVVPGPTGPQARLLLPGPSWRLVGFPTGAVWLPARVQPELSVDVSALP